MLHILQKKCPNNCYFSYKRLYTSIVRVSNSLMAASLFKGISSVGPNIDGKYSGNSLPRIRLASVTVNGPLFL